MLSENNQQLLVQNKPENTDLAGWIYTEIPEVFQDYVDKVAFENGVSHLELYPLMMGIQQLLQRHGHEILNGVYADYGVQGVPVSIA